MDWNDTIILKTKDNKRLVTPRSVIKFVGTVQKRDYSRTPNEYECTVVHLDIDWAYSAGIDARYSDIRDKVVGLELDMDLNVVLGLLRGDKAAEVLF